MTRVPEPRYARTPDGAYLAYQVVGDGPVDLLFELDYFAGLDLLWENPDLAAEFRDLASFSRLILYDRRGIGLSSRNVPPPNLETRADDLRTVLDEVGSESAVLFSLLEGGAPLALVASTTPERVRALAWWNPVARSVWTPDYPWGVGPEYVTRGLAAIRDGWGTERYARTFADLNVVDRDPDWLASTAAAVWIPWIARVTRAMATPDVAEALERIWYETDIRGVLPSVRVPTLLMGRQGFFEDEIAYVASLIPNAVVRLVPGTASQLLGSFTEAHAELRRFLGIERPLVSHDTVLSTVLFTDIVESTARQASIGDRAWKSLVERHHALVRDALGRWRGSEADTAGDGFFATFDGPARAIRCALEVVDGVRELGIEVRAGLHTGECELVDGKAVGVAVSIGARVVALAGPSEVLVSQTVKDLVAGSGLAFEDGGEHELKGVPDRWRLYRVLA